MRAENGVAFSLRMLNFNGGTRLRDKMQPNSRWPCHTVCLGWGAGGM